MQSGREKEGVGIGKVREPGLELGMPEAQWRYIRADSAHYTQGYWLWLKKIYKMKRLHT